MKNIDPLKDSIDFYLKNKKNNKGVVEDASAYKYLFFTHHAKKTKSIQKPGMFDEMADSESIYFDGPNFQYYINENGFRSKSFSEFNQDNVNILFLGCSITQGAGLPEECMWTTKLVNKIENDILNKQIDHYNLSTSGAGIHLIIKNLITFLNTVGKPDYVFAYFPQISRSLIWDSESYINAHYASGPLNQYPKHDQLFSQKYVVEDSLMYNSTLIHMMELICNLSGIKLIWSTWYLDQTETINRIRFNNYFDIPYNSEMHYAAVIEIYKKRGGDSKSYAKEYERNVKIINSFNVNNEPYWSSARDGWHFGTSFHNHVAEQFYKELKDKYI